MFESHPEVDRLRTDPLYQSDASYRASVEMTWRFIAATRAALAAEGFGGEFAERVINRILYGEPNGAAVRTRDLQALNDLRQVHRPLDEPRD